MEWIAVLAYIIGAIIAHLIVYKDAKVEEIQYQTANIVCIMWPVALVIYGWLCLERLFSKLK